MKKNEEKAIKTRRKRKRGHYIYYNEEGDSYGTVGSQGTARFSLWTMKARG